MLKKQQTSSTGKLKAEELARLILILEHVLKEVLHVTDVEIVVDVDTDDL